MILTWAQYYQALEKLPIIDRELRKLEGAKDADLIKTRTQELRNIRAKQVEEAEEKLKGWEIPLEEIMVEKEKEVEWEIVG